MRIEVLLFGPLAEAFGAECLRMDYVEGMRCADLHAHLHQLRPDLSSLLDSCRWAQNHRFVSLDSLVMRTDELAVIPPVAGG